MVCAANLTLMRFQSTLPHGSDLTMMRAVCLVLIFQSTLPHGSDPGRRSQGGASHRISIHAPSRERPAAASEPMLQPRISIHAPSRERPRGGSQAVPIFCHFNPRSLTGATIALLAGISPLHNFNPRSLTGATLRSATRPAQRSAFQSTLPHGSDRQP